MISVETNAALCRMARTIVMTIIMICHSFVMRQCTTSKTSTGYILGPVQTERFEAENKSEAEIARFTPSGWSNRET